MGSTDSNTPIAVLNRFYDAERRYMAVGGKASGDSFSEFAGTLADDVILLHQTPDLPWGGEYVGVERYADWAAMMSDCFDTVDVQDATFVEKGDQVVVLCTLVTKAKRTGEVMSRPVVQVVEVKDARITDFRPFYWHVPDYVAAYKGEKTAEAKVA
jgi:ketosteroid isomerase-like protein